MKQFVKKTNHWAFQRSPLIIHGLAAKAIKLSWPNEVEECVRLKLRNDIVISSHSPFYPPSPRRFLTLSFSYISRRLYIARKLVRKALRAIRLVWPQRILFPSACCSDRFLYYDIMCSNIGKFPPLSDVVTCR